MVWEVKSKRAFILENLPELIRSTVRICHQYGSFHSLLGRYFDCRDQQFFFSISANSGLRNPIWHSPHLSAKELKPTFSNKKSFHSDVS